MFVDKEDRSLIASNCDGPNKLKPLGGWSIIIDSPDEILASTGPDGIIAIGCEGSNSGAAAAVNASSSLDGIVDGDNIDNSGNDEAAKILLCDGTNIAATTDEVIFLRCVVLVLVGILVAFADAEYYPNYSYL